MHQMDRLREKTKNSFLKNFAVEYFGHQGKNIFFIVRGAQEGLQAEFLALIHNFTVCDLDGFNYHQKLSFWTQIESEDTYLGVK